MDSMKRLCSIVARLRAPDGCPWDREQTHESIRNLLIEECYEVVEAIDETDDALLREELGDVLLHLVFHAQLAEERGAFKMDEVIESVCDKLVRRHPHVFGEAECRDASEVLRQWDAIKQSEKPHRASALDGVPPALPALMQAREIQKKAAKSGFDWDDPLGVIRKTREELDELEEALKLDTRNNIEDEIGDLLFSLVNLARHLGVDAEQACRGTNRKFQFRFRLMEAALRDRGVSLQEATLAEMEALWQEAKQHPDHP